MVNGYGDREKNNEFLKSIPYILEYFHKRDFTDGSGNGNDETEGGSLQLLFQSKSVFYDFQA